MSFDVFVHRFENGELVPLDAEAARELLAPHAVGRDSDPDFLQVSTGEYEWADVYFGTPTGITFNRFGGEGIMDLLAAVLERLDATLVVPGGPTVVRREEDREHVHPGLRDEWPVVVARTGAEITAAIESA
ncbi:hypothetical protein [Streptomyces sp. bgisy126]|uniref:hypothetical protein n=1 Tax=unclassified Streptomyces TaxID=2593676 RepID=UPI003EBFAB4D